MKSKFNLTRRDFLGNSAKGTVGLALGAALPNTAFAQNETVKLGMNIPMTGDYAPWGLPGLYGCEIVANNINAAGGVEIGGTTYNIEMASYDHGYEIEKAVQGYKKLVLEDDVKMVMMLGGS